MPGRTLLAAAALAITLIGARPCLAGPFENENLLRAVQRGNVDGIAAALAEGANPDYRNEKNWSVLLLVEMSGNLDAVTLLLKAGAKLQCEPVGNNTLESATLDAVTSTDNPALLDLAIVYGCEWRDPHNEFVRRAIARGARKVVHHLLQLGFDPSARFVDDSPPLLLAAFAGETQMVQEFLDGKADVNVRDRFGSTALILAAGQGREDVVALLLQHAANARAIDNQGFNAAKSATAIKDEAGRTRMLTLLASHEVTPTSKVRPIDQAFLDAAAAGDLDSVRRLLKQGADLYVQAYLKQDPYFTKDALTASVGHANVCEFLLEHGADPRVEDRFEGDPLFWAASSGSLECLKALLAKGANPNRQTRRKQLPLFTVINFNRPVAMAEALLKAGTDPNATAFTGNSMLYEAEHRHRPAIVKLLRDAGAK